MLGSIALAVVVAAAWMGAVAFGAVLAGRGLRGRLVDDHVRCRACRFIVYEKPCRPERCSECGASLLGAKRVTIGRRAMRPVHVAAGVALLIVAALPVAMHLAAPAPAAAPVVAAPAPIVAPTRRRPTPSLAYTRITRSGKIHPYTCGCRTGTSLVLSPSMRDVVARARSQAKASEAAPRASGREAASAASNSNRSPSVLQTTFGVIDFEPLSKYDRRSPSSAGSPWIVGGELLTKLTGEVADGAFARSRQPYKPTDRFLGRDARAILPDGGAKR